MKTWISQRSRNTSNVRAHHVHERTDNLTLSKQSHSSRRNNSRNIRNHGGSTPSRRPLAHFSFPFFSFRSQTNRTAYTQSAPERTSLIVAARAALDELNLHAVPTVAGIGAASTRESIQLAREAAAAGADFAIAIPPGYYAGALIADSMAALRTYFLDIAEASPIPV